MAGCEVGSTPSGGSSSSSRGPGALLPPSLTRRRLPTRSSPPADASASVRRQSSRPPSTSPPSSPTAPSPASVAADSLASLQFVVYPLLLFCRLMLCFSSGYVHPDEFFQTPEPMAASVLGVSADLPWEYADPHRPARSAFIPALVAGVPFRIIKAMHGGWYSRHIYETGALLMGPRLAMFLLTLLIDWAFVRICQRIRLEPWTRLVVLASSYVTLIFNTRPLSNAVESLLVALLLLAVLPAPRGGFPFASRPQLFRAGVVAALGLFNRPSFIVFLIPAAVYHLWNVMRAIPFVPPGISHWSRFLDANAPRFWTRNASRRLPLDGAAALAGFAVTAAGIVLFDSTYFGTLELSIFSLRDTRWLHILMQAAHNTIHSPSALPRLTLAPLNNLLYNADIRNLSMHGLHPPWQHFCVNLPLLFGPMTIMLASLGVSMARAALQSRKVVARMLLEFNFPALDGWAIDLRPHLRFFALVLGLILLPTALLSLVPHQEARFLAPLLVPFVLLFGRRIMRGRGNEVATSNVFAFMAYNVAMVVFFSVHQCGVVPTMGVINTHMRLSPVPAQTTLVSLYTYPLPMHLLGLPTVLDGPCPRVSSYNLGSASNSQLYRLIDDLTPTTVARCPDFHSVDIFVIAPSTVHWYDERFKLIYEAPHFSTEAKWASSLSVRMASIPVVALDAKRTWCVQPVLATQCIAAS